MNTLDVIDEILNHNREIDLFTFYKYPTQVLLQDVTDLSQTDKEFVSAALNIRNQFHLPFRDSLMLSFFDKKNMSEELISNALIHHKNTNKINTCDIKEIRDLLNTLTQENLALNSEVIFKDQTVKHFFLLDFHIYPSVNNLIIISDILKLLKLTGYILNSGESYHFISDSFFDIDSLLNLLAKSLFFAPIVDRSWIAHQLLERSCSLRVGVKHGIMPTLVKKV